MEAAARLGLVEKGKVAKTCQMLKDRANIGVSGEGRWATEGPNSSSVYDYGVRVADSLQTAVNDGIMYGQDRAYKHVSVCWGGPLPAGGGVRGDVTLLISV